MKVIDCEKERYFLIWTSFSQSERSDVATSATVAGVTYPICLGSYILKMLLSRSLYICIHWYVSFEALCPIWGDRISSRLILGEEFAPHSGRQPNTKAGINLPSPPLQQTKFFHFRIRADGGKPVSVARGRRCTRHRRAELESTHMHSCSSAAVIYDVARQAASKR